MTNNNCKHNVGIHSRGNIWFCSGCGVNVPAPEIPKSIQEHNDDYLNLSREDYSKKYNLEWDGSEFPRTFRRLGFWKSVRKYGWKRTVEAFEPGIQGNRII